MAFVKHKLGRTYYLSRGRKDQIPLIALHGGPGGTCEKLKPLLELSKIRKVYIYDQLGGGKSSRTDQKKWNIKTFVEELDLLIKAWGIKEFDLFGASWGTTLALEYYLRKRGKGVRSLIFQSPMFSAKDWEKDGQLLIDRLPAQPRKVINYCHEIGATDSKVYSEAMFEFYLRHVLRDKKKLRQVMSEPGFLNLELYEYMWGPSEFKPTGTLKNYDRTYELFRIKVPTLFICGQYDEARPATARRYTKSVPGARFKEIKGCSHAISIENKIALLREIKNFLG